MSVPNYKKENGNLSIINYIHTPTTTHQNIYYHTVHKAGNTKVPHVRVQRYMLCAKCRFAPSLDRFTQNPRMARIHTLHITCLTKCMVQCAVYRLTSDGDLGEGEEEGGGAGLGMGDVLGGVVTFDVTVGGARCECV